MNQNIRAKGDDTMTATAPFRYDIVGSFLRPASLKAARKAFEEGTLSLEALSKAEDEAILDLVEKEKACGLKAVTDGEFRRRYCIWTFWLPLMVSRKSMPIIGLLHLRVRSLKHPPSPLQGKLILRTIPS